MSARIGTLTHLSSSPASALLLLGDALRSMPVDPPESGLGSGLLARQPAPALEQSVAVLKCVRIAAPNMRRRRASVRATARHFAPREQTR